MQKKPGSEQHPLDFHVWVEKGEFPHNQRPQEGLAPFFAVMASGIRPLNHQKAEYAFCDSIQRIDISLLKWINYAGLCLFFFGLAFHFCHNYNKDGMSKWPAVLSALAWILYVRQFLFQTMVGFPLWLLPGTWSDIKGWQNLGSTLKSQLQYIIYFQDYPLIQTYYKGTFKSIACLFVSCLFLHFFLMRASKAKAPYSALLAMALLSIFVSIYYFGG